MGFLEQAAQAYTSRKFVDPMQAMGGDTALKAMYQNVAANSAAKRNKANQVKNTVASYTDKLSTDVDLTGLNEVEQSEATKYLSQIRNEYVETANMLARMDPGTSEYIELKDKLSSLSNAPKTLANSIAAFKTRKAEFLDDSDNNRFSVADTDQYDKAGRLYTDQMGFRINPNGTIFFDDNGEQIQFNDFKDPAMKNYELANSISDKSVSYEKGGKQMGVEEKKALIKELEGKFLEDPMAMASIVEDDLIANLSDTITVDPSNAAQQAPIVAEMIANSLEDIANQSYSKKQSELTSRKTGDKKLTQSEINRREKQQRIQNRTATVVDGLLENPMSTIRQYLGAGSATMDKNTRIITIPGDDKNPAQTYDMNRAEDVSLLASQLDASKYGYDDTQDRVSENIPTYIDDIRTKKGKKRVMTKDAQYYIDKYSE